MRVPPSQNPYAHPLPHPHPHPHAYPHAHARALPAFPPRQSLPISLSFFSLLSASPAPSAGSPPPPPPAARAASPEMPHPRARPARGAPRARLRRSASSGAAFADAAAAAAQPASARSPPLRGASAQSDGDAWDAALFSSADFEAAREEYAGATRARARRRVGARADRRARRDETPARGVRERRAANGATPASGTGSGMGGGERAGVGSGGGEGDVARSEGAGASAEVEPPDLPDSPGTVPPPMVVPPLEVFLSEDALGVVVGDGSGVGMDVQGGDRAVVAVGAGGSSGRSPGSGRFNGASGFGTVAGQGGCGYTEEQLVKLEEDVEAKRRVPTRREEMLLEAREARRKFIHRREELRRQQRIEEVKVREAHEADIFAQQQHHHHVAAAAAAAAAAEFVHVQEAQAQAEVEAQAQAQHAARFEAIRAQVEAEAFGNVVHPHALQMPHHPLGAHHYAPDPHPGHMGPMPPVPPMHHGHPLMRRHPHHPRGHLPQLHEMQYPMGHFGSSMSMPHPMQNVHGLEGGAEMFGTRGGGGGGGGGGVGRGNGRVGAGGDALLRPGMDMGVGGRFAVQEAYRSLNGYGGSRGLSGLGSPAQSPGYARGRGQSLRLGGGVPGFDGRLLDRELAGC